MPPILAAVGHYRRVIVVCGAQMGKTGGLLNVIGKELDDSPAPILYVGPTKNNVSTVIEPQIAAMLRSVP
ncbi:MAG: phage terminase large subunit family protein, partial [Terriglobales bacterium]